MSHPFGFKVAAVAHVGEQFETPNRLSLPQRICRLKSYLHIYSIYTPYVAYLIKYDLDVFTE